MRLKAVLLGSTALSILGAPVAVQAGEMDWAGFYAGLGIVRLVDGALIGPSPLENQTPATVEAFAGYNHVSGNMLVGGEVDLSAANFQEVGDPDSHFQGMADLKGKLGYAGDGWSAYVLGGVSGGSYYYYGSTTQYYGFNFGAGAAVMATDNLFVGVELLQRNLPNQSGAKKKAKKIGTPDTFTRTISARVGFLFD